jgi:pumilio family protein 6
MTNVSRKRQSTHGTGQEPEAKKERNISKSEKPRKSKRTNDWVLKRDSKMTKAAEKPNWSEFKKKKKELRKTRKEHRCTIYGLLAKSKKLWEKVRRSDCPTEQREKLTSEIHNLLRNNLHKVVYSHDLSRVVQWLLKIGTSDLQAAIIEELTSHVPAMLQSKYACFCVKRMLKYGSHNSRKSIIRSLHGKVVKLASHSVAAPILDYMYSKFTSASQKSMLQQEFYGDMYKQDKESNVHSLDDVFQMTPSMKGAVLSSVKANLSRILDKKLTESSLLHTVLCEYLRHCLKEDREEVLSQIQNSLLDFTNTRDGAHVALLCVWHASNKVKKLIMKSLKGHVMEVAKSEHGHLILLALFDSVDDTVLLKKMLMPELMGDLWSLANDKYGRKVVLYLVAHRDPLYFHSTEVDMLRKGAALSNSKKDVGIRTSELLDAVSEPLLEAIENDAGSWISTSSIGMVTLAVLKSGKGSALQKAFVAIAEYISDITKKITEKEKQECFVVEHSGTHLMLKKLIQHDKQRLKNDEVTFSSVLVSKLTEATLSSWITYNRGCFLLVAILESTVQSAVDETRRKLQPLMSHIEKQTSVGASILHKRLTT